jgi:hypothetical protein
MTRTNESTGEKYCSCGHWTEDPQFTCDDKTENTCTEGKCPQDEVCISTIFLDGSFAGCGCSDPSPDTNLP